MRRASTFLLLAIALGASGACFAQAHPQPSPAAPRPVDADADAPGARADATRSPFGKVMAVMITALQRQTEERSRPAAPVRTTAAGTPMDIEIGAAFRDARGARGAAAQEDLALGQAALAAGPD